jgi:CRP-like cAMP-binding protein
MNAPVTNIPNSLLAALPRKSYQHLLSGLVPVTLALGDVLYEAGAHIRDVYFPGQCLVSLLTEVKGHRALEVGMVGCEGMVGFPLALGIDVSPVRALVQGAGTAMRMKASRFQTELRASLPLQSGVNRYVYAMMGQISQTAACNRFHLVEARLARWLLMTQDRVSSDKFRFTQEFIALMLGVRRAGVNEGAAALQRRKLIRYSRGTMQILDRAGLLAASCTCYGIIRKLENA